MNNPYKIDGPAVISFSGGRTSAFMLHQIVQAHGGSLPPDVLVVFANTGLEHEATYDFVEKCSERIAPVIWVEYARIEGRHWFRTVTPKTSSRNGEPMEALIHERKYLPNPVTRFCTQECKIRPITRYIQSELGWDGWTDAVGLRYDEPARVAKIKAASANRDVVCPIHSARHTLQDVMSFWHKSDFDLQLPMNNNAFGNCVGCFLKGNAKRIHVFKNEPEKAHWWIRMEEKIGHTFRKDAPPYKQLLDMAVNQQTLDFDNCDLQECNCTD